jgi:hypothetical protein
MTAEENFTGKKTVANEFRSVESEVLTTVVMKCSIFRDVAPCSPLKVNRRFGVRYRLHHEGRIIGEERNQR